MKKQGTREESKQVARIYSKKYARNVERNRYKVMQAKQKAIGKKLRKETSIDLGKKVCKK